jgi:hypothetical protein
MFENSDMISSAVSQLPPPTAQHIKPLSHHLIIPERNERIGLAYY